MEITNKNALSCSNYLENVSPSLSTPTVRLFYLKNKGNYHCHWFANWIQINNVQFPFKPPSEDCTVSCHIFYWQLFSSLLFSSKEVQMGPSTFSYPERPTPRVEIRPASHPDDLFITKAASWPLPTAESCYSAAIISFVSDCSTVLAYLTY